MLHLRFALPLTGLGALLVLSAPACALVTSGIPDAMQGSGGSSPESGGQSVAPGSCASADCETLPEGWTLVRAREVAPSLAAGATVPACIGGATPDVYFYGPVEPACGPCTCGMPQGASCSAPQITCSYSTDDCATNDIQLQDSTAACSTHIPSYLFSNSNGSCQLTGPGKVTSPGTCAAQGGGVTPANPFEGSVIVCPQPSVDTGCDQGRACLPSGDTADGSLCITRPDATPCPAGWTGQDVPAFEGASDTRACAACACEVGCSGGGYVVYTEDFCWSGTQVTIDSTTCAQAGGIFDWSTASFQSTQATAVLGACNPPAPSGVVEGTGVHQVCCR